MTVPRLVLDTNVVLSATLFRSGTLAWMHEALRGRALVPLRSDVTWAEFARGLCYPKFRLSPLQRDALLAGLQPLCEFIAIPPNLELPDCRDSHDRPFLALALAGQADALVTGDQDLLVLAPRFSIPILPPAEARARFGL